MKIESLSVRDFCVAHRISRAFLYKLWKRGDGPAAFKVGKLTRISASAAMAWMSSREEAGLATKSPPHLPAAKPKSLPRVRLESWERVL